MINRWRKLLRSTYNTYSVYQSTRNAYASQQFHSNIVPTSNAEVSFKESLFLEPEEVPPSPAKLSPAKVSVLDEQEVLSDVSHVGPPLDFKSFNFAAFVNESDVLKKLVDLGVDFHSLEKQNPVPGYLINLDLKEDVAPHIQFLLDNGLKVDDLGRYFTKNPYFFKNSLSNLRVRINYLESKKFDRDAITKILINNTLWLNYSTVEIDRRLGYFQREFKMKASEVRLMLTFYSSILNQDELSLCVSGNNKDPTEKLFEFRNVQEFTPEQCKRILVYYPRVWVVPLEKLRERLEYVMLDMEIPRRLIVADPVALFNSRFKLRNRHTFLKCLGRAQYNPKEPNYVSMRALCLGNDAVFCQEVAKTSIETYNLYLKTL